MIALLIAASFVQAGAGVRGTFPSVTAGVGVRLGEWTVEGRYDTVAGLAHDVGAAARLSLDRRWEVGLDAMHGFFAVEDLGGIHQADSPLGNGLTTTARARWRDTTRRGVRWAPGFGLTARWTTLARELGTVERRFEPSLHHVEGSIDVDWQGGAFLRLRALVPIEADLRVFGFLPILEAGHTWSL